MQKRSFAPRLRPLEARCQLEGDGSELNFGNTGRWGNLFFAGRSGEVGRCAGATHAARRERNAAGANSGEAGGRLATEVAGKFGSAGRRAGVVWLRVVSRSVSRPSAHVALRRYDGLSHLHRAFRKRQAHHHRALQSYRPGPGSARAQSRRPISLTRACHYDLPSGEAREFAQAFHLGAGGQGAVLLHHLAHLHVLLEDLVDLLHGGAAAFGDALAALAVDDVVVAAFLVGHGIDDGFEALELALVDFGVFGQIRERADLREHVHDLVERTHLAHLLELVAEVFEGEVILAEFAFELGGGFFVDGQFGALDEGHDVAHAEDAGDDTLGIKAFEGVVFFAEADEFDRGAGNFADGEGRAAAGVAIELGEDDAGQAEALVKFAGGAHRVLTDHGVGDEEDFGGLQFLL